ncbi:polyketide synthase [Streptococcus mutans]|uniref:beta-ketoacyl synthase N-terminal-like domain-containing protein n=1 Tax=Streptococcus mutans TaxID=1309 RepID=UPI0002B5559D|nr:beta-ketoacyl synthase N-terminal-like domain-containing protein [Streptococcus mutans]EMB79344.1 KR domain protein [Streptococcus mutans 5SM3]EMB87571.1 KR domain protein [Streptococcus mutans N29]EMB89602.1 KR domain protein [Streptococcus mutans NMT4863]MCB4978183.1 condensation domain-containing protein [Streptococcus mutans]MCB5051383.1 condensation domain-containing protein [Streptococcus mutans]
MGILDDIVLDSYQDTSEKNNKYAIIGISGLFPESESVDDFFNKLLRGKDFIRDFPEQRKSEVKKFGNKISKKDKSYRHAAYLNDISSFDNELFQLSDAESRLIDPKQRLLLMTAYRAFEDAGILEGLSNTQTGVFIGNSNMLNYKYFDIIKTIRPDLVDLSSTGNMDSMLSSRISYYFNLKGPSVVIDTACSSSLFAVDQAINSISCGECDLALVGGAHILMYPENVDVSLGIESKDERTRTFDDSANGTGVGEAVGAVVIKRLDDAIEDKNYIYCVIDGVLSNQDGDSISITSPDRRAQSDLQLSLWEKSSFNPEKTVYVEAHGTATHLGDDVEIRALTDSFRNYTDRKQFCGIGTVKTNIGHTIDASGISSLIKCIKIIENKIIPPTINFSYPNRNIDYEDSPFYIVDKARTITEDDYNILINSFGLSGTNTHIILSPFSKQERKTSKYQQFHVKNFWVDDNEKLIESDNSTESILISLLVQKFGFLNINSSTQIAGLELDSIFITRIYSEIDRLFPNSIEIADLYSLKTVGDLAKKIEEKNLIPDFENGTSKIVNSSTINETSADDYAIIGIDLNIGQNQNKDEFYNSLLAGDKLIDNLSSKRIKIANEFGNIYNFNNLSFRKGNYLQNIDLFDYSFFNIPRSEAMMMDPNARLMLTSAYKAIVDAGYDKKTVENRNWGTFISFGQDYLFNYGSLIALLDNQKIGNSNIGNMAAMISGRISYLLDLKGPSITIDSSCSSSLSAISLAIDSIKDKRCEAAIVGGVKLNFCPIDSEENDIGILANSENSYAFDDKANGTYTGEGVATIIIKSKSKAMEDNDRIYATICGMAVNHDGKTSGLTVPNPDSQTNVILDAWKNIEVEDSDELYIETHGTATKLGDPIEISGINRAFNFLKNNSIGIGSVKNNIGHLFELSGLVGIIKAAMSLYNEKIPKNIGFMYPNKNINFTNSKVYINDLNKDISGKETYIGVSSFGFSGTNAHLVLKKGPLNNKQPSTFEIESPNLTEEKCWISDYLNHTHTTELDSNKTIQEQLEVVFTDIFGNQKDLSGNIYELGGDSLTAVEIAGRLNKIFNLKLTVADILRNNSIDSLSNLLLQNNSNGQELEIVKSEAKSKYLATPQQIRMYKMTKSHLETGLNVNICLHLRGVINIEKLNNAFNKIIEKNEAFRTRFIEETGQVFQVIIPFIPNNIVVESAPIEEWKNIKENFIKVFDLKNGPLFRIKLLQSSPNNSILLFDAHHIIFDFQSMKIFLSQLIMLYNEQEVPESLIDYTDYSEWYNQQVKLNRKVKLQEWVNELKDAPINSELIPIAVKSNTVSSIELTIDSILLEKLEKYSAKENVSLFSVLLATYFKTNSVIESEDKQIVGIPVSGRDSGNVNNIIGLFRNSLPIYLDLSKIRSDRELVLETQSKILSAMEKQEIQTYEIEKAMGINNLFTNYFIYQDSISSDNFKMNGLEVQTELIRKQGMFNIKWEFVKIDGCLQAIIEYRNEVFIESEIMYLKQFFLETIKEIIKE